jgi:hypothetical protein
VTATPARPIDVTIDEPDDEAGLDHEDQVNETLRAWHNDTHPGAYQFRDQQPCDAIRRLVT